jgi:hypothetical protein
MSQKLLKFHFKGCDAMRGRGGRPKGRRESRSDWGREGKGREK